VLHGVKLFESEGTRHGSLTTPNASTLRNVCRWKSVVKYRNNQLWISNNWAGIYKEAVVAYLNILSWNSLEEAE